MENESLRDRIARLRRELAEATDALPSEERREPELSREQLHALVDNCSDIIGFLTVDGTIRFASASASRVLGKEVVGQSWLSLVHPDDRELMGGLLARCLEQADAPVFGEVRGLRGDGEERLLHIRLSNRLADPALGVILCNACDVTDRQRIELQFQALIESAPDAFVITDLQGRITLVNRHTEQLFGYDRAELVGQRVEVLLPERLRPAHVRHREGYLGAPRVRSMGDRAAQLQARRKDGTEFPAQISLSPAGDRSAVVVVIRDATDSVRLIRRLEASEQSLASAHHIAGLGTWEWDLVTQRLTVSSEIEVITGVPKGSPLEAYFARIPLDVLQQIQQEANDSAETGGAFESDLHLYHTDGRSRIVRCSCVVLKDELGQAQRLLGSAKDVTVEVNAALLLRNSEEKYRRIVETSLEGVWAFDRDHRTTFVNTTMAAMLGYTPDEMLGRSGLDFAEAGDLEAERARIEHRKAGKRERYEVRLRGKDGRRPWVVISSTPIFDPDGSYGGTLAMMTDVTEQKSALAALQLADRMASVGVLAAGVAHEINSPLAVVLLNLELISDLLSLARHPEEEPAADLHREDLHASIEDARDAALRVRAIVRDLKLFSRADEESTRIVDPVPVMESAIRMAGNEIRHRARLEKHYGPIPRVHASGARLCQVFINLLVNAAQSIPDGRSDQNLLTVTTSTAEDGAAVIAIKDTGGGIPAEILSRIFDPFFTTKPRGVGTGLGLSICQRIVGAHGGTLTAESVVGKGSTFQLTLPAAAMPAAPEPEPARSTLAGPRPATRRSRILVVDDEPQILVALGRMLEGEHDVQTVSRANQALEWIREGMVFDLILCDLMMPEMTGMDLHAALLQLDHRLAERMVFITGGAFSAAARAFLAKTSNARLEKPFDSEQLRALLSERLA